MSLKSSVFNIDDYIYKNYDLVNALAHNEIILSNCGT